MSYHISDRQLAWYLWGAAICGFILGSGVGAYVYMLITSNYLREAVR